MLPGEYKVVWRMMRAAQGSVGMEHSDLQCSAEVHPVHPTSSLPEAARDDTVHKLQHFNSFPVGEWRDLPGGCVTVTASAHVHVRMWCHTGDWKRGLLWDYVKLEDVNKVTDPNRQTAHEPAPVQSAVQRASTAVEAAVDSVSTACRLQ